MWNDRTSVTTSLPSAGFYGNIQKHGDAEIRALGLVKDTSTDIHFHSAKESRMNWSDIINHHPCLVFWPSRVPHPVPRSLVTGASRCGASDISQMRVQRNVLAVVQNGVLFGKFGLSACPGACMSTRISLVVKNSFSLHHLSILVDYISYIYVLFFINCP